MPQDFDSGPQVGPLRELRLAQMGLSVGEFVMWRRDGDLDMDQPYQRGHVWGDVRRRNLIRSLLMGLPVGAITVNRRDAAGFTHQGWPKARCDAFAIIDGKQRLTAITRFVGSELAVPAGWFPPGDVADGGGEFALFRDLALPRQRFIKRISVAVSEARLSTLDEEREVFDLINFGGLAQGEMDGEG